MWMLLARVRRKSRTQSSDSHSHDMIALAPGPGCKGFFNVQNVCFVRPFMAGLWYTVLEVAE